jgi:cytosine/adenosine deaminase-related metal-dependent hydrolase
MRCLILACLAGLLSAIPVRAEVEVGRILVKNAVLFTLQADETSPRRGYLLAGDDGKILRVGYGDPPPGIRAVQTLDESGKILMPGFVSAHSHAYQAATRGLGTDQALDGWLTANWPFWHVSAADHYYDTLAGCFDLLRHGITSAYNFNDGNGQQDFDVEGFKAELASGIRFVHGYCLPIRGTRESRTGDFEAFYAYTRSFAGKTAFLGFSLGGYACVAPDKDYALLEGELMQKYGLSNQAHYLESAAPSEVQEQRSRFGWFAESGELGPRLAFAHLVHPDDAILRRIAAAGASMVWNPLSNGRLASGTADIPRMRSLGIRIGMGVDGQASADVAEPFENMRSGLYAVRAKYQDASVLLPRDVLGFHTLGAADVIGVAGRVGSLERGKFADFLIIDPHRMETGPVFDPYGTLVLACGTANIEKVYVGARLVVDNGNLVNPDFLRVTAEVSGRMARLRAALEASAKPAPPPR